MHHPRKVYRVLFVGSADGGLESCIENSIYFRDFGEDLEATHPVARRDSSGQARDLTTELWLVWESGRFLSGICTVGGASLCILSTGMSTYVTWRISSEGWNATRRVIESNW